MDTLEVKSFEEFYRALPKAGSSWNYRGQADADWPLVPKVGREQYRVLRESASATETSFLEAWKRRAFEFIDSPSLLTDWDWLAVAQHHGLATRLLDWTRNPLAAAFFAVEPDRDTDAAVYTWRITERIFYSDEKEDPMAVEGIFKFNPRRVAGRIGRQSGLFSVHGPPTIDLAASTCPESKLRKIVIGRSSRRKFRGELHRLGADRSTLFPDLDGLSSFMNWFVTK